MLFIQDNWLQHNIKCLQRTPSASEQCTRQNPISRRDCQAFMEAIFICVENSLLLLPCVFKTKYNRYSSVCNILNCCWFSVLCSGWSFNIRSNSCCVLNFTSNRNKKLCFIISDGKTGKPNNKYRANQLIN